MILFHYFLWLSNIPLCINVVVVQALSRVQLFATPWMAAHQASLSFTTSQNCSDSCPLSRWCHPCHPRHPLLLLPSIFPAFSGKLALRTRWLKRWSFSFSTSPSNVYSGFISFRIDWFDFLAVQETLKRLLWHHSSKASILHCSAFFMVQLLHLHMTTGKTIALTIWTFVSKLIPLLFNALFRFVITFLPRSKHLELHGCSYHLQWFWSPPK